MTEDRGAAALAERLAPHFGSSYWPGQTDVTILGASPEAIAAAILGEHGRFYDQRRRPSPTQRYGPGYQRRHVLPDGFDAVVMGEAWSAEVGALEAEIERLRAALTIIADGTSYDPAGSIGVTARNIARVTLSPEPEL